MSFKNKLKQFKHIYKIYHYFRNEFLIKINFISTIKNNRKKKAFKKLKINKIVLITDHCISYYAKFLCKLLIDKGFDAKYKLVNGYGDSEDLNTKIYDNSLYIFLFTQIKTNFPKYYVIFNREQSTYWVFWAYKYLKILNNSLLNIDYSLKNINHIKSIITNKSIIYMPHCPNSQQKECLQNKTINILFYGNLNHPRRKAILNKLKEDFNIEIIDWEFGDKLNKILDKTFTVLNIHSNEDSILETCRICECISHDCLVISEHSSDLCLDSKYKEFVDFIDIGDINAIKKILTYYRKNQNALKEKIIKNRNSIYKLQKETIKSCNKLIDSLYF